MKRFYKIFRPHTQVKSRFHNMRGTMLPPRAFLDIPSAVLGRWFGIAAAREPWMTSGSVRFLKREIQRNWRVFEYGSGVSTLWYANHASFVVSIEDNRKWFERTKSIMEERQISNCDLRFIETGRSDFIRAIDEFDDESFDLVIVDGQESQPGDRMLCLDHAKPKVRINGLIVLDDSDRSEYSSQNMIMAGWEQNRFPGVKHAPLATFETTIYRRLR